MKLVTAALSAAVASALGAAVDLQVEIGLSRARIREDDPVMLVGFQPALIWRGDTAVTPALGLRFGPVGVYHPQDHTASGCIETRLLAGFSWLPEGGPRCDMLVGWGGGYWHGDEVAGDDGWGRVFSTEATATWLMTQQLRVGPHLGWQLRELGSVELEEWRLAVAVAYRLDG